MINQQWLTKEYFNLLVQEFIKDANHEDITIVFKDYLEKNVLGKTFYDRVGWDNVTYTIYFLNHYKNEEELREVVVHEFTHLYLYSLIGKHKHDDTFYFNMDRFEDWMDKKWGLTARQNKGDDWEQHISLERRKQRKRRFKQGFYDDQNYSNNSGKTPLLISGLIVLGVFVLLIGGWLRQKRKKNSYE